MPADLWTAEDVAPIPRSWFIRRWVCRVSRSGFHNGATCREDDPHGEPWHCGYLVEASLSEAQWAAALAEAGRLLPTDGEWEWAAGTRYVIRPATPDRREAEAQLRSYGTQPGSQLLRRWVGPWQPVQPEPPKEPQR